MTDYSAKQYSAEPEPEALPADDCSEFELRLLGFLAEAYARIDPRQSIGNAILGAYLGECLDWAVAYRRWRDEISWWPSARDLEEEYQAALAQTPPRALRPLLQAGVTAHALEVARPALIRLHLNGSALFEPDPDSRAIAFIVPVRVACPETPESLDPEDTVKSGAIVDLVAFAPSLAARWALRIGSAEWLGACGPQYMTDPEPVRLHKTPLDWLRASCDGLVCLAARPIEVYRFLTRFPVLAVDDDAHAASLREILARPLLGPEIVIGRTGSNGR